MSDFKRVLVDYLGKEFEVKIPVDLGVFYIATDEEGSVYIYDVQPNLRKLGWSWYHDKNSVHMSYLPKPSKGDGFENWKESLREYVL